MTSASDSARGAGSEVDVLVFGAGAAGMTAALVAALEGCTVLLCEGSDHVGGTTATSAGTLWIPGNRQSRAIGLDDTQEAGMTYLDALIGVATDRVRRAAFIATGPDAIDYLVSRTDVQFTPAGRHPDYLVMPGAATSGRAIGPLPFDGRQLGRNFSRVRPPIGEFMLFGGMMVGKMDLGHLLNRWRSIRSFWHAVKLVGRYAVDRLSYARGTRLVMGNALVGRLYMSILKAGVQVNFGDRLHQLTMEDGRVNGAIISTRDGQRLSITARRGVVLATGGASAHPQLRRTLMPGGADLNPSLVVKSSRGGGVAAGLASGGVLQGTGVYLQPVSRTRGGSYRCGLFPHLFLDRSKPGLIAVNGDGSRFVNEASSYHHFCEAMLRTHARDPSQPAWLICDSRFVRKYGIGIVHPGTTALTRYERRGDLVCADSVRELAGKIGIDADGLGLQVERNNYFAITGVDEDFNKGQAPLDVFNGDPAHAPNPCIGLIEQAPFCAMAVWPADAGAMQGLGTDEHGRVLSGATGLPIPGLYACGNDMSSVMGSTYPGPGVTLGQGVVFGYIVAVHLSHS